MNFVFLQVLAIIKQELSKTQEPRPIDVLALAVVVLDRGSPEQVSIHAYTTLSLS